MSKYTSEQYNKVFWKLPQEIRDMVSSFETTKHIQIVGQKHNLHIDKIGELVDVTLDVMMGIVGTKDFVKELQDNLQISALEASVLARDIDENIFKPIKETMTHLYAGRAPYKPSSSLVQYYEEDDEHPALSKDSLLKEIEDPVPAEVKKETTTILPGNLGLRSLGESKKEMQKTENPHTEITEYHEELQNEAEEENRAPKQIVQNISQIPIPPLKKIDDFKPNEAKSEDRLKGDSILNQIASLKLNQAFVMPKGPEGIKELSKIEAEQLGNTTGSKTINTPPTVPVPEIQKPVEKIREASPETLPPKPEIKVDPYREPI